MTERICKNCEWWKRWGTATKRGNCRIKAPVVVAGEEGYSSVWPDTNELDFCGEFKEKSNGKE